MHTASTPSWRKTNCVDLELILDLLLKLFSILALSALKFCGCQRFGFLGRRLRFNGRLNLRRWWRLRDLCWSLRERRFYVRPCCPISDVKERLLLVYLHTYMADVATRQFDGVEKTLKKADPFKRPSCREIVIPPQPFAGFAVEVVVFLRAIRQVQSPSCR